MSGIHECRASASQSGPSYGLDCCHPDGFDAYDLNGNGGVFPTGVTTTAPLPFTFSDADTLTFMGNVFKRTGRN
jgi:hypothetical protein